MFLHIGKDQIIPNKSILAILDVSSIKESKEFITLIQKLKENNALFGVEGKEEKTFILVEDGETKGYFSNISSVSLAKRL